MSNFLAFSFDQASNAIAIFVRSANGNVVTVLPVARSLENYAALLRKTERATKAEALEKRAQKILADLAKGIPKLKAPR